MRMAREINCPRVRRVNKGEEAPTLSVRTVCVCYPPQCVTHTPSSGTVAAAHPLIWKEALSNPLDRPTAASAIISTLSLDSDLTFSHCGGIKDTSWQRCRSNKKKHDMRERWAEGTRLVLRCGMSQWQLMWHGLEMPTWHPRMVGGI